MPLTREKAQLMSASEIDRTLVRLAHEILEKTKTSTSSPLSASAAAAFRWRSAFPQRSKLSRSAPGPGRHSRHQSVSRRPQHGRYQARGQRHRDPVQRRRQRHHPDGRRAVHRPHHSRGARRAVRPWPPGARAIAGADRPRPPRIADRSALHRPHGADHRHRNHRSEVPGDRRHGKGAPGGTGRRAAKRDPRCPPDCSESKSSTAPRSKRS